MKDITIESNLQSLTPLSLQKKGKPEGAGNSFSTMLQSQLKK